MTADLSKIETIVVILMENRSFDHMLGYLSLPPYHRPEVEGLRNDPAWLARYANLYDGNAYVPFELQNTYVPEDPPHERDSIALQLGSTLSDVYPMNGFAKSYSLVLDFTPAAPPAVMGYHTPRHLPTTDFFANYYAICDHWFCPLPAGTQPNRFMAMSGISPIDNNAGLLSFPDQDTVYDWLTAHGVRWRVYSGGLPFFFLMDRWRSPMLGDGKRFRALRNLAKDVQAEGDSTYPQVIFVEPCYTDDPFHGPKNDDHPTTAVDAGQELLARVYRAFAANPKRWSKTAIVITYDEHGGFFDHVSPLPVITNSPAGEYAPFTSTGPRVPAYVLSPLVSPRRVFHKPLDHTSILKMLGDKFAGGSYSAEVDARTDVGSVTEVFDLGAARVDVPLPQPADGILLRMSQTSEALLAAGLQARMKAPKKAADRFPGLWSV